MMAIVGLVVILVMVFGGYALAGGKLGIILAELPFEFIIIGGAALGTLLIANDGATLKALLGDLARVLKGPKWRKQDYVDLLSLLFELLRMARNDPVALEVQIEDPAQSEVFRRYPRLAADPFTVALITDTLRAANMQVEDPHQQDELLERDLELHHAALARPADALSAVADALPALGIVAAVLGVIKTMGSIDQPPAVLGKMIGSALVGTFLGVFLAYCLASPLAARIRSLHDEDHLFYKLIRDVLLAHLHRHPPNVCVEIGRKNAPDAIRPNFAEVETMIGTLKAQAGRQAA